MIALARQLRPRRPPAWPHEGARARLRRPGTVLDGRTVRVLMPVSEGDPARWWVRVPWNPTGNPLDATTLAVVAGLGELRRVRPRSTRN